MTFRARLVLAAAVAVVVAIILAALAAYLVAERSLVNSLDSTLYVQASSLSSLANFNAQGVSGDVVQAVTANSVVLVHLPDGSPALPVDQQVRNVAAGTANTFYTTVQYQGSPHREVVAQRLLNSAQPVALQLVTPLAGVNRQLARLRLLLTLVAAAGVALAALLGWLVGRTALRPLNALTDTIEEVAATTDVTRRLEEGGVDELGRLRRAFNRLLTALERSRESQRMLVLDAAHELRTPLTSLRTNMEVARQLEALPSDERSILVDDVVTQMDELTKLVGDMAELARGELQQTPPAPLRFDLLVEDLVAVAATHGRPRDITVELTSSPTWVLGRADRLERAIGNLLDNAVKWSPDGGKVEVTCRDSTVWVRDHGPGIADEDLPHVFDRFYRAPAARSLPGSGLGLAIVAQVAAEEGGAVNAGNAPDGGASFSLALPSAAPVDGNAAANV